MQHYLHIDYETRSDVPLKDAGVFKYVEGNDFKPLLLSFALDRQPASVIDLSEMSASDFETKYPRLYSALFDPTITKVAHNATFERTVTRAWLGREIPPENIICTMVLSYICGLPAKLDLVAKELDLTEQKDGRGKLLINLFTKPRKPTAKRASVWVNPCNEPQKWAEFKEYCRQDTETERAVFDRLKPYLPLFLAQQKDYALDQRINEYGIPLDIPFINRMLAHLDRATEPALQLICAITQTDKPNSLPALKKWLSERVSEDVSSLDATKIELLLCGELDSAVRQVLEARQVTAKSSSKKYESMVTAACSDARVRGTLQYHGARTGRYSGRLVQPQNMPSIHVKDIGGIRQAFDTLSFEELSDDYDNVHGLISQLVRTAITAPKGRTLASIDYSAIEARVLAWVAGEQWRIDVFNTHGKIYEASASLMFNVPIEEITKDSPLRKKGKVSELALGYEGGVNALIRMGGLDMGLKESELKGSVKLWRGVNPNIVLFWGLIQEAAIKCVATGKPCRVNQYVSFERLPDALAMILPSGRRILYWRPELTQRFGKHALRFWGIESNSKKWMRLDTYGGKLTENCIQAIARDLMVDAMQRATAQGFDVCFTVHDELIFELDEMLAELSLVDIELLMKQAPAWAKGLPLNAEGYVSKFYKKD